MNKEKNVYLCHGPEELQISVVTITNVGLERLSLTCGTMLLGLTSFTCFSRKGRQVVLLQH